MKLLTLSSIFLLSLGLFAQSSMTFKPSAALGKDAEVFSNNPSANYAHQVGMAAYTWTNNGNLGIKRIYLAFDWSALPSNAIVDSAKLHLYFSPNNSEAFFVHTGQTDFFVERVTSNWTDTGITWNNQPSITTQNRAIVPAHINSSQNYHIDVSQLVLDMMSANQSNYGFCIKMQNEINPYRGILIASSEDPSAELRPSLTLFYHLNTNITELEILANKTTIYPNPSSQEFVVQLPEGSNKKDWKIAVFDLSGRLVSSGLTSEPMPKEELIPGLYIIKLEHASGYYFLRKQLILAP